MEEILSMRPISKGVGVSVGGKILNIKGISDGFVMSPAYTDSKVTFHIADAPYEVHVKNEKTGKERYSSSAIRDEHDLQSELLSCIRAMGVVVHTSAYYGEIVWTYRQPHLEKEFSDAGLIDRDDDYFVRLTRESIGLFEDLGVVGMMTPKRFNRVDWTKNTWVVDRDGYWVMPVGGQHVVRIDPYATPSGELSAMARMAVTPSNEA